MNTDKHVHAKPILTTTRIHEIVTLLTCTKT